MSRNKPILIARNIPLSARLTALEIWVSPRGDITIYSAQYGYSQIPKLTTDYLDSLCSKHYYGTYTHRHAIADVMLLEGILSKDQYSDLYLNIDQAIRGGGVTVVASLLFR